MDNRLPAHLEVSGILRLVQSVGGFATVLAKGERDAGTLIIICCENGTNLRAYERMPSLDGGREWVLAKTESHENKQEFSDFCERRKRQDSDLWLIECDVRDGESLLGITPRPG